MPNSRLAPQDINILMMGDSITNGGYYITTLQRRLADHGIKSTVLGKCAGDGWYINMLDRHMGKYLSKAEVNRSNTYILLLIGTNNVGDSEVKDRAPDELGALIAKIKRSVPKANLIVGTLTPRLDYASDRIPVFNAAFAQVAKKLKKSGVKFTVVDMYAPMNADASHYLRPDKVHPNTEFGHPLMAGIWYDGIMATAGAGNRGAPNVVGIGRE